MKFCMEQDDDFKIKFWINLVFALYVYSFTLLKWTYVGYFIIYGIPVLYLILNYKFFSTYFNKISKKYLLMILIFIFLLVVAVVVPSFYGTNDYSYVKTLTYVIRKGLIYSFLAILIYKHYNKGNRVEAFLVHYSIATMMYVCGTIIFVLFPSIKDFWFQFVLDDFQKGLFSSFGYTFRVGWMGFSGFQATLKCTVSVIFIMYLLTGKRDQKNHIKKKVIMLVCLVASLLGNAFYGRVGLLCSGIVLILYLIAGKVINLKRVLTGLGIIAVMFMVLFSLKDKILIVNEWYVWMTTPFKNLIQSGDFNNASVNELVDHMIFMPEDKTFWMGDGRYVNEQGGYYMETDSGFMRQVLFWGIINTILCYTMLFLSVPKIQKDNKWLLLPMIMVFIVFEIKGEAYYDFVPLFITLKMLYRYSESKVEDVS